MYHAKQSKILEDLTALFPKETVQEWLDDVRAWENGAEKNPYEETETGECITAYS